MTKRDFFILFMKIIGLYLFIASLFSGLPSTFLYLMLDIDATGVIWILGASLLIFGLFYLLLYKADSIVDILKLEKGFDESRINFSGLKNTDLIKFTILIIGGFLIVENLPSFLTNTLFAFKSKVAHEFSGDLIKYNTANEYISWASSALNLLVGYILIKYYKRISQFLEQKVMD